VLAPIDLVRRVDGHDVLLPLCTERLARFLQRRAGRGVALSEGEAVTVVVSVLRGTADVLARHPFASGEWWLTDTGKPVFVHGEGPDALMAADLCLAGLGSALPEVADLRARMGSGGAADAVAAGADLAHPRALSAALPELEHALFARSAPEALATTDLTPARARAVGASGEPDDVLAHTGRRRWSSLTRLVDSDLREVVAVGWDALRETRRRRVRARADAAATGGRGRRIAIAAGGAALVAVAVAMLWPSGGSAGAPGAEAGASPTGAAVRGAGISSPGASAPSASPAVQAARSGPTSAIRAMLVLRAACPDDACRDGFLEQPGHRLPAGAVDDAAASVALLDEYGGAAVVRMTSASASGSGRSQLVVVVKSNEKWLVRDVTDAADQP
jgi:hypothetical protein